MPQFLLSQVDVFSPEPFLGNPVAVVHDAGSMSDALMARFARWTNLSETTFVLPPRAADADYRLRIFTPGGELPFAGHPTLGSCHAWLEEGGRPQQKDTIVQECDAGLVSVRRSSDQLAFAAPALLRSGRLASPLLDRLALAFGLPAQTVVDAQWVDNGPGWCALLLDSAQRVLDVSPDMAALGDYCVGLVGAYPTGCDVDFEVRAFVPGMGVPEDPVTGSLNAGIAQWLIGAGLAPESFLVSQGTALGRAGRIHVSRDHDELWVGGATRTCIRGNLTMSDT